MAVQARQYLPAYALEHLDFAAIRIADRAQQSASDIAAGCTVDDLIGILHQLKAARSSILEFRDIPGLRAYAQAQRNDGTYEIITEYSALIALIDDAANTIRTGLPTDPSNYLLAYKLVNDNLAPRNFTALQVAPVILKLQAISDAVT